MPTLLYKNDAVERSLLGEYISHLDKPTVIGLLRGAIPLVKRISNNIHFRAETTTIVADSRGVYLIIRGEDIVIRYTISDSPVHHVPVIETYVTAKLLSYLNNYRKKNVIAPTLLTIPHNELSPDRISRIIQNTNNVPCHDILDPRSFFGLMAKATEMTYTVCRGKIFKDVRLNNCTIWTPHNSTINATNGAILFSKFTNEYLGKDTFTIRSTKLWNELARLQQNDPWRVGVVDYENSSDDTLVLESPTIYIKFSVDLTHSSERFSRMEEIKSFTGCSTHGIFTFSKEDAQQLVQAINNNNLFPDKEEDGIVGILHQDMVVFMRQGDLENGVSGNCTVLKNSHYKPANGNVRLCMINKEYLFWGLQAGCVSWCASTDSKMDIAFLSSFCGDTQFMVAEMRLQSDDEFQSLEKKTDAIIKALNKSTCSIKETPMSIALYRHGSGACAATIAINSGCDYVKPVSLNSALPLQNIRLGEIVYLFNVYTNGTELRELCKHAKEVHFFDHRKDILDEVSSLGLPVIIHGSGTKSMTKEVWEFFHPSTPMPFAADLSSRFTMWDLDDNVLKFYYGSKTIPTDSIDIWKDLLLDKDGCASRLLAVGESAFAFFTKRDEIVAKHLVYETLLSGYRMLAANTRITNSLVFNQIRPMDPEITLGVLYQWNPQHKEYEVTVSRIANTSKVGVSVKSIVEAFGGGGSYDVGGFRSKRDQLPFSQAGIPTFAARQDADDPYLELDNLYLGQECSPGLRNVVKAVKSNEGWNQQETKIGIVPVCAANLPHLNWDINRWNRKFAKAKVAWVWEPWFDPAIPSEKGGSYRLMIEPVMDDPAILKEIVNFIDEENKSCLQFVRNHTVVVYVDTLPFLI